MTAPDILIAGGGVIGLMTAWRLAGEGLAVTVVDAGAPSATAAAAGMLAPSFERALHAGVALEAFARAGLQRWRALAPALEAEAGIGVDLQTAGILSVAFAEEDSALPEDKIGGAPLTPDEARALEPALGNGLAAAWFAPEEGQIDPRALLRALPIAIARRGGAILRGKRVVGVDAARGAVTGVKLAGGERLSCGAVVLATGARIEGLSALPPGAVFPVKGEALSLAQGSGAPCRVIRTRSAYLCPKADGRLIVGATEIERDRSLTTDGARIAALKAGACRAAPALAGAREIERWAGLRPATADALPIIGPAPEGPRGLLYALGHYRNGVLLAPATADAIAETIAGGGSAPMAFSAARFNRSFETERSSGDERASSG
jgi:glycine oxidase